MEFEKRNNKNPRPAEGSKNLPTTVLVILFAIILLLLFVGWSYLTDTPSNAEEMVPTRPDVVAEQIENETVLNDETLDTPVLEDANAEMPEIAIPTKTSELVEEPVETKTPVEKPTTTASTPPKETKPASVGGGNYTHTVASAETFFSIATRYNVSVETLKGLNNEVDPSSIKVGVTKLSIPVQAIHTVGPGDVLRVVANKYNVSLEQLMKANNKSKNYAQRGEKLIVPFREKK